ncbi:MAG: bifunctional serine/threonine-protein kinase/formylglycine-generating enzyme family protein [Planctomycetota bacterium]
MDDHDQHSQRGGHASEPVRLETAHPGRYRDFVPAGLGGMGAVYRALDTEMHREIAFKIIRADVTDPHDVSGPPSEPLQMRPPPADTPASAAFEHLRSRFLQEAWITGGLEHPGIVPVYELGQTSAGVPYYTMRFLRGRQTLAKALDDVRGASIEQRLALLEPFLKVCDTIRYAHSKRVLHRDLKPENIVLGTYGEVVVIDWGLARLQEMDDLGASRWQEGVETFQGTPEAHMTQGAIGTPGYMAPEMAVPDLGPIDERSDLYSLGVLLFEILTGQRPFEAKSFRELVARVVAEPAPLASDVDAAVPQGLATICGQALERRPADRPSSIEAWVESLRAWQVRSDQERRVEDLRERAAAGLVACEQLAGAPLLQRLDEVTSVCSQLEQLEAGASVALGLRERASLLREQGIQQRERSARRRTARRLLAVGAVVLAGLGLALFDAWRGREAEATVARRLSASRSVQRLVAEVPKLWPLHPNRVPSLQDWLARFDRFQEESDTHRADLEQLTLEAPSDARAALQVDIMTTLLEQVELLGRAGGASERVRTRLERAGTMDTSLTHADAWREVTRRLREDRRFAGFDLSPQLGLVPLGPDPRSGLEEFAFLPSGTVPPRAEDGMLVLDDDMAMVFVLLPAGNFWMGAQADDEAGRNYDAASGGGEQPVHQVRFTRPPCFLAKFECTQGQWETLTEGEVPSGHDYRGNRYTKRHPVESVSYRDCVRWSERYGLRLPLEVEWEYAARTGLDEELASAWARGTQIGRLVEMANISDVARQESEKISDPRRFSPVNDGFGVTAPVGSLAPNRLGLYDMLGNVWEWVQDHHGAGTYPAEAVVDPPGRPAAPEAPRAMRRGGSWATTAEATRIGVRGWSSSTYQERETGWRPARDIERAR